MQPATGPVPPFESWQPNQPRRPRFIGSTRLIVAGVLVVLAGAVVLLLLLTGRRPSLAPAADTASPEESLATRVEAVRTGDIITRVLARCDIEQATSARIVDALMLGGFNFRAMRPGDSVRVFRRADSVVRFEYWRNPERCYRIDLDDSEARVSMIYRPVLARPVTISGAVESSLYESVLGLGEDVDLVIAYADIFGWEVDFFCETQPGDSFAVLFERRMIDTTCIGYGRILAARYSGQVGDFRAFRFADPDGHVDHYNRDGQSLRKTFLKSPLQYSRVSSRFGRRFHPIRRIRAQHQGVDYVAPRGTPVSCVAEGTITAAGWNGGYGRLVEIRHPGGYTTRYGHLWGFARGVRRGARLAQGQVVGYVGSTGVSTGPHLHYEVRHNGNAVNPLRLDVPRAASVREEYLNDFAAVRDSLERQFGLALSTTPPPQPVH